jgi:hypothetical protein
LVLDKDIVLATFGGSIGLAGLLLVFQGFIISAYRSLPSQTPQDVRCWYRWTVHATLVVLLLATLSISASLAWLLTEEALGVPLAFFSATLVAVLLVAGVVSRKLVK